MNYNEVLNVVPNNQRNAILRTCASCEWIFKWTKDVGSCPMCGFGHYGARFCYGNKAYRYAITQQPWKRRKLEKYESELDDIIYKMNPIKEKSDSRSILKLASQTEYYD